MTDTKKGIIPVTGTVTGIPIMYYRITGNACLSSVYVIRWVLCPIYSHSTSVWFVLYEIPIEPYTQSFPCARLSTSSSIIPMCADRM